jgi:hypothetical protein
MSLFVFDLVLLVSGIRGHIPQHGDFGAGHGESLLASNTDGGLPLLAAAAIGIAAVALFLWAAVWLAIQVF